MSCRYLAVIVLLMATHVLGDVFSYECDSLPLDGGWTLGQSFCDPVEEIYEGQLFQYVNMCPGYDPPVGAQISYRRYQDEYLGRPTFFMEWVVETTGDSSEIPWTAPVSFSAWNGGSINYMFVIAKDLVEVIRDLDFPYLYIGLEEGVGHRYRVELYADTLYRVFIDDVEIDSGIPEGDYLTYSPGVAIRAKAKFFDSVAIWDYIRWGDIPVDGSGDWDSDGDVDMMDYYRYLECFTGPDVNAGPGCRFCDFDDDTDVDVDDFSGFQSALNSPQ